MPNFKQTKEPTKVVHFSFAVGEDTAKKLMAKKPSGLTKNQFLKQLIESCVWEWSL